MSAEAMQRLIDIDVEVSKTIKPATIAGVVTVIVAGAEVTTN